VSDNDERPLKAGMVEAIRDARAGGGKSLREPIDWKARAEAAEKRVADAAAEYDGMADHIGTCGDGNCLVKKPVGMHTNGGCRCNADKYRASRMMMAGRRLRAALEAKP
jgi:hypothetical protein